MPETHVEQDDEVQALLQWIAEPSTRRPGLGGAGHATPRHFIAPSVVKEYLGAGRRVEELLVSIFGKEASNIIDANAIRNHYGRTLAILLLIGEGGMIKHFVRHTGLRDHRLPYRSRPPNFPLSIDTSFFDRFFKEQWQFCPAVLEYNMDLDFSGEDIIPLVEKTPIGHGGNAVIYKIKIDGEHNKLVPEHWKLPERPSHLRDTFVLKTYRGPDAKDQYKREHYAFMNLRYDEKPTPFVIAYYGSYVDKDTYNIIVEYADGGNLEDFMRTTTEPSTIHDTIELWDRLSCTLHGLAHIHGIPGSTRRGVPALVGWHQDIKPANILVFSGSGKSGLDVYFKIADLSLCHFKPREVPEWEDSDLDAFGTQAYGAPETFRLDDLTEALPVQVRPEVDVWSLGCVFSEAAVWSRFGWRRVLEYRRRRQREVKEICDLDGEHIFHNGEDVLRTVREIHGQVVKHAGSKHQVTAEILRLVNNDMLLSDVDTRVSAKTIYHRSRLIIKVARKKLKDHESDAPFDVDVDSNNPSNVDDRPKTPPQIPPEFRGSPGASTRQQVRAHVDQPDSSRTFSVNPSNPHRQSLQNAIATRRFHSSAVNGNRQDWDSDALFGPFSSDSMSLHDLPNPPSPVSTSSRSSFVDKIDARSIHTQIREYSDGRRSPHRRYSNINLSNTGSTAPNQVSMRRSHTERRRPDRPRRRSIEGTPASTSEPNSLAREQISPTPSQPSSPNNAGPHHSSNIDDQVASDPANQTHKKGPDRPYLSLDQGLSWKNRKKQGSLAPLPGFENLSSLNERDHIFIIDNSASMRTHRSDVLKLIELLAYMVKDSDPDGPDIHFTQSTQKIRSVKKSRRILAAVREAPFAGISDMRNCLSRIFQSHKNEFGTTTTPHSTWYRKTSPAVPQKPLSFYILTDGIWQPNEVGPIIKALADSLRVHQLPKEHVGIQFIRFGRDQDGIDQLTHLDCGLGLKDIDMDIVDHTFWNGNIWKQLLGAINPWYDDDPD